jgi:RimJ/RimL family protein N-acetyltransferase
VAGPPPPTSRLAFREMTEEDLDLVAGLLGDPAVMRFYPAVKTRAEALDWIHWNTRGYQRDGFGLWLLHLSDGTFVGECGLTWQEVDGVSELELGYHLLPAFQGQGLATEAASACRDHARSLGVRRLIAITVPSNRPSQAVAERVGLTFDRATTSRHGAPVHVHALGLHLD